MNMTKVVWQLTSVEGKSVIRLSVDVSIDHTDVAAFDREYPSNRFQDLQILNYQATGITEFRVSMPWP